MSTSWKLKRAALIHNIYEQGKASQDWADRDRSRLLLHTQAGMSNLDMCRSPGISLPKIFIVFCKRDEPGNHTGLV